MNIGNTAGMLGTVFLAAFWQPVQAADYEIGWCIKCSADQYARFAKAAMAAVPASDSGANVYVVNRAEGIVKFFRITGEFKPGFGIRRALEDQGDPAVLKEIDKALSVHQAFVDLKSVEQLPGLAPKTHYDSALDMVGMPERQEKVADAINRFVQDHVSPPLSSTLVSSLLIWPYNDPAWDIQIGFVTEVNYPDGSFDYFELMEVAGLENGGIALELEFRPEMSEDAGGHRIPQAALELFYRSSDAPITGASAGNYRDLAERFNVPISTECGSEDERFGCVKVNNGPIDESYSCTYYSTSPCPSG